MRVPSFDKDISFTGAGAGFLIMGILNWFWPWG